MGNLCYGCYGGNSKSSNKDELDLTLPLKI